MYPANIKQVKTAQCSFLLFSTDLCIIFFLYNAYMLLFVEMLRNRNIKLEVPVLKTQSYIYYLCINQEIKGLPPVINIPGALETQAKH